MRFRIPPAVNRLILCIFGPFFILCLVHDAGARTKAAHRKASQKSTKQVTTPATPQDLPSPARIERELKSYLGIRYRLGGADRRGMDCSGFVRRAYDQIYGIHLPHNAARQSAVDLFEQASLSTLQAGDLVFFKKSKKSKRITHVGIYLGKGRFIHASQSKGITISSLNTPLWKSQFYTAKRLAGTGIQMARAGSAKRNVSFLLLPGEKDQFGAAYIEEVKYGLLGSERDLLLPVAFENADFAPLRMDLERRRGLELAYSREILSDIWNVRLSGYQGDYSLTDLHADLPPMFSEARRSDALSGADRKGLKIASSVRPFEWLNITPSLEWLEKPQGVEEALPDRALGLQLEMASVDLGWSLSTRVLYTDQKEIFSLVEQDRNNRSYVDLSFTIQHRLTESSQVSFMGRQVFMVQPGEEESYSAQNNMERFFSFSLSFDY